METKLSKWHKKTGVSQIHIAKKIGITSTAYSKIVKGETTPYVQNAIKIARALNTTVEDLWGELTEENKN
ncbi:helix-turn-helix transcriptional regulator [Cytobacillus sp. FSL R7-0696]|mgnify:CR=1 FL=1|uniref:helix-turn-helix transcriptional regulator n=1 Tax=Cytobacillus sp. FSL R7-0696 TaxID=2921691 RepID=UPI0030F82D84